MDLNKLYFEHQVALIGAASGPSDERAGRRADAIVIAGRITEFQDRVGAVAAELRHGAPQCPTFAGCAA